MKQSNEHDVILNNQPLNMPDSSVQSEEFVDFDELLAKLGDDDQIASQFNQNNVSIHDDHCSNDNDKMICDEDSRINEYSNEREREREENQDCNEVKYGIVTNPDKFFQESEDENDDGLISGLNRYVLKDDCYNDLEVDEFIREITQI